jgi:SDR family mycofactocin-dependent oxidoreductase
MTNRDDNNDHSTNTEPFQDIIGTRRQFIRNSGGLVASAAALTGMASTASAADKPLSSNRFAGRVAVITGGARGMGRSHAEQLAREGADIVICDIAAPISSLDYPLATPAELAETQRRVEALGRKCLAVRADVRDTKAMQTLIDRTIETFGKIDYLLANAGILSMGKVADLSDAAFDDVMQTNVYGVFNVMRAALPHMQKQNFGRIVVTSSMAGRGGIANLGHYAASKWAVIGLVKSAALETARQGITVNAVCPTAVATPILLNDAAYRRAFPDKPNPTKEEFIARMEANPYLPQGVPWVEPIDVTNAILFLLSEEGRYISGEAMTVAAGSIASNSA